MPGLVGGSLIFLESKKDYKILAVWVGKNFKDHVSLMSTVMDKESGRVSTLDIGTMGAGVCSITLADGTLLK